MTEDEAKTRWCPFARVTAGDSTAAFNRGVNDDADPVISSSAVCVASSCMAWRWTSPPHWRVKRAQGITVAVDKDTPDAYQTRGNGFCGIAGKPETL